MPSKNRMLVRVAPNGHSTEEVRKTAGGGVQIRNVTKIQLYSQGKNYSKDYGKLLNYKGELRR